MIISFDFTEVIFVNCSDKLCSFAESLLKECRQIYIASVDADGYPRVCVVSPVRTDGCRVIWFISPVFSEKVRQFRENPKARVCYGKNNDYQILIGTALFNDINIKRALLKNWLTDWFPGCPDDRDMRRQIYCK